MKYILIAFILISSNTVYAVANHCGEIQRLRTWSQGTDTYGVWVEYKNNPSECPGGFYLEQNANNRELVFSTLLASKMANENICIQVFSYETNIDTRCRLHYVYHP